MLYEGRRGKLSSSIFPFTLKTTFKCDRKQSPNHQPLSILSKSDCQKQILLTPRISDYRDLHKDIGNTRYKKRNPTILTDDIKLV